MIYFFYREINFDYNECNELCTVIERVRKTRRKQPLMNKFAN